MKQLRKQILSAACMMIGLALGSQGAMADIYTYALQSPVGSNGGTIGGTITVVGNPGDPFPALNAASAFSLSYVPVTGPTETWTQADTIAVTYHAAQDFIASGELGMATIFSQAPSSGADFWTVTNASGELDLFWTPSPYGPNWVVRDGSSSVIDNQYASWTLTLQSDVVPEPGLAAFGAFLPALLLVRRRIAVV